MNTGAKVFAASVLHNKGYIVSRINSNVKCTVASLDSWKRVVFGVLLATMLFPCASVPAQTITRSYPPAQYYVGLAALREGALVDAVKLFEQAIRSGRTDTSGKWIDSIPAYVMLAECHFQMGNMAQARLELDRAIGLMSRENWLSSVQWPANMPGKNTVVNVGNWAASTRRSTMANVPDQIAIMRGSTDTLGQIQRGGVLQTAQLVRVDVAEIMRSMAWCVMRRSQILGPLSEGDPLLDQLRGSLQSANLPPGLGQPWSQLILSLIAIAGNQSKEAMQGLSNCISLPGNMDHPLTPIALLTTADLMAPVNPTNASNMYMEAALSAVAYSQYEVAAEAFLRAVGPLAVNGSGALMARASGAALQLNRKSQLLAAACYLVAAESAAVGMQPDVASRALNDASRVMKRRGFMVPRLNALSAYCSALAAQTSGNRVLASQALAETLAFSSGNRQMQTPHQYQMTLVAASLASGGLGGRSVDELLASLTQSPSAQMWASDPINALSASYPNAGIDQARLATEITRQRYDDALQMADELLANRFRNSLPLGGRMLDLYTLVTRQPDQLADEARQLRDKPPAVIKSLLTRDAQIRTMVTALAAKPIDSEDVRQAEEMRNQWSKLGTLADESESMLGLAALRRMNIPRTFPPLMGGKSAWPKLAGGNAMIVFAPQGNSLIALMLADDKVSVWPVPNSASLVPQISRLVKQLGAIRKRGSVPQLSTAEQWQPIAAALGKQLLGGAPRETLQKMQHITIVPFASLWYLPFELLPLDDEQGPRLGDSIAISYAPTPGLALDGPASESQLKKTGAISHRLLAPGDVELEAQLTDDLIDVIESTERLPGLASIPSSLVAASFRRIWVAAPIRVGKASPLAISPLSYDQNKPRGDLASWMQFPSKQIHELLMPGFQSNISVPGNASTGDELFQVCCALQAAGVEQVLISRWAVGGESTKRLMEEYLNEAPFSPPLESWRRSVVLLKSQQIDPNQEPLLNDADKKAGPAKGDNPLFWAGYMMVGAEIQRNNN